MLTSENVRVEFERALPEFHPTLIAIADDPELRDGDGQPLWHVAFSDALAPVYEAFEQDRITPEWEPILGRLFAFLERMLTSDDDVLGDVASASIVECLSNYPQIERFYGAMPPELERSIRLWRDAPSR